MRKQVTNKYAIDDGEVSITIQALGGMEGSALGLRIGEIMGPSIGTLVSALDNNSPQGVGDALRAFFEKLPPSQFKAILKQVLTGAQIQIGGEFLDLTMERVDEVFSGNVSALYRLWFDAVRLNFANFSQGLGVNSEIVSKLVGMAKSRALKSMQDPPKTISQPTSPGPVGD